MAQRVGVVVFPGTNCEHDVAEAVELLGAEAELVWHGSGQIGSFDALVLPGGFAHGDYVRPGAIARFSPVMNAVGEFARSGGPVVGICNGFQILAEAHLLPGALQKNRGLSFLCQMTEVEVASDRSALTAGLALGRRLRVPINHFEGNYTAGPGVLRALEDEGRVVLRYVSNPNGAAHDIAGICNEDGNVVGLMPHPERATSELLGSADGTLLLRCLLAWGQGGRRPGVPSAAATPAGPPVPVVPTAPAPPVASAVTAGSRT
ncbi:MAG: phosphoribosylformylglycinamidine synthase subunit PurQ [Acidimicrobiales bacterium]